MERAATGQAGAVWPVVATLRRLMSGPQYFAALLLSALLNAMQLSASLYLFHIYERVLPTGNRAELALSTGLLVGMFVVFALLDFLRARLLGRAGASFARDLERHSCKGACVRQSDLHRVRHLSAHGGLAALFDALWLPVSLAGLSLVHPLLALYALLGATLIAGIAVGSDTACRSGVFESSDSMLAVVAAARAIRLMLQFGGIGFGALLVIEDAVSAGGLIAASVMMGRAFAVLDGALVHRRSVLVMARCFGATRPRPKHIKDDVTFRRWSSGAWSASKTMS